MKTTLLTTVCALALAGLGYAQTTLPITSVPAGVTVSGDVDTTSSSNFFNVLGYALYENDSITIDFGQPVTGSFDLIDVDTATSSNSGEEARLQVDGGSSQIVAGPATANIPNNQAALPQNIVTVPFSGQTITISANNFGEGAFAVSNVTFVPEPSSALLVGLSSLALLRRKR